MCALAYHLFLLFPLCPQVINCNPETVSTDYDESDRLYFEDTVNAETCDVQQFCSGQKTPPNSDCLNAIQCPQDPETGLVVATTLTGNCPPCHPRTCHPFPIMAQAERCDLRRKSSQELTLETVLEICNFEQPAGPPGLGPFCKGLGCLRSHEMKELRN